jgi:MoaA/NifB/PqqE/SkfB family radical SAM enzyme
MEFQISPDTNKSLAEAEFVAGATIIRSTPVIIGLESTSRCNLRCVMCPHVIGEVSRPKHLDDAIVEKMRTFVRQSGEIALHGIGEPTNSPAFWRVLADLPPRDQCRAVVNSNFTVVDADKIEQLVASNLTVINVSLDAATEPTYRRIRGFSFAKVLGNIEQFLAHRHSRGQAFPQLVINMTLMRSNIDELPEFMRLAHRLGVDRVAIWHLNHESEENMARYVIERDGWTFNYALEGLWNYPALSDKRIREAIALSEKLSVPLYLDHNKSVFFNE